jgi:meiotic recombination protein REC8, fungi type
MPWNLSVSRHGSARPFGRVLAGAISSSVGGQGARIEVGPPSAFMGRHGSRFTSASPLLGRRGTLPRYSSLELPEQPKLATDEVGREMFDDGELPPGSNDFTDDREFQLYGPAAMADTQTAAQSQWVTAALDVESQNFLAFLRAEIDAKIIAAEQAGGQLEDKNVKIVTFEGLLPLEQHSKVVAAQGLLHVLSLATKGLVEVRQENAFGTIQVRVVVAAEEGNEEGGQNMEA